MNRLAGKTAIVTGAGRLIFRSDPSIHREAFAILNPANNNKPLFQINM